VLSLLLAMLAFIAVQAIRLPEVGAWKCEKHPEQPTCTTTTGPPVTVPNTTERTTVPSTTMSTTTTSSTSTTSTSLPPQSPPGDTPPLKFAG